MSSIGNDTLHLICSSYQKHNKSCISLTLSVSSHVWDSVKVSTMQKLPLYSVHYSPLQKHLLSTLVKVSTTSHTVPPASPYNHPTHENIFLRWTFSLPRYLRTEKLKQWTAAQYGKPCSVYCSNKMQHANTHVRTCLVQWQHNFHNFLNISFSFQVWRVMDRRIKSMQNVNNNLQLTI